jgi:SAM-dependent methyltransferase
MRSQDWDRRHAATALVRSTKPSRFLVAEVGGLPAGRALDLACGEGRNAIWLAERGWQVTGVDFSQVGLEKARRLAAKRGVEVIWVRADLLDHQPVDGAYDLVVFPYPHLPAARRREVLKKAAAALASGGTLLMVGHDRLNLAEGHGGPQNLEVLFTAAEIKRELPGLLIGRAERVQRPVTVDGREVQAIDALVRAKRLVSVRSFPVDAPGQRAAAALAYDRWFESRWGRYASRVEWRALARDLGRVSDARIVDVGCGTGRFTHRLEEAGARVVGVDVDAGMLDGARSRVRGPLLRAQAEQLPFEAGVFDIAVAVTVLEFVHEPERALAEMARVTRSGGRLVIGALNLASPWGLAHQTRLAAPPWTDACFLSRARLLSLGSRIGRARIRGALFAPGDLPGLPVIGPVVESAGTAFSKWGAFQVLTVEVHG